MGLFQGKRPKWSLTLKTKSCLTMETRETMTIQWYKYTGSNCQDNEFHFNLNRKFLIAL